MTADSGLCDGTVAREDLQVPAPSAFREYVTNTAFHLNLSKVQCECLSQIDQMGTSWLLLTTFNALMGKGLVTRKTTPHKDHPAGKTVELTEAGRAVIPLLKLAGLYREIPVWPEAAPLPEIVIKTRQRPVGIPKE